MAANKETANYIDPMIGAITEHESTWEGKVSVQGEDGADIGCVIEDGWLLTKTSTTELTVLFDECRHAERHHPDESGEMTRSFAYLGPWISQADHCSSLDISPNRADNFIFAASNADTRK